MSITARVRVDALQLAIAMIALAWLQVVLQLLLVRTLALVVQDGRQRNETRRRNNERVITNSSGLADQGRVRTITLVVLDLARSSYKHAALGRDVVLFVFSPVPFATENRSANLGGSLSPIFDGQRDGTKVGWYGRRRGGRIVAVLTLGFVTRILCASTATKTA